MPDCNTFSIKSIITARDFGLNWTLPKGAVPFPAELGIEFVLNWSTARCCGFKKIVNLHHQIRWLDMLALKGAPLGMGVILCFVAFVYCSYRSILAILHTCWFVPSLNFLAFQGGTIYEIFIANTTAESFQGSTKPGSVFFPPITQVLHCSLLIDFTILVIIVLILMRVNIPIKTACLKALYQ